MKKFFKKGSSVLLITIFIVMLFVGCSSEKESVNSNHLQLATDWPFPFHGNPFGAGGVGGAWWFMYEPFAYYLPMTGEYIPRLAENWEIDGNDVKVYLRKDVKFSDGELFTAEDVINTVNFIQALWGWPYDIKEVKAIDSNTVIFTLTSTNFVHTLLTDGAIASLAPLHVYSDFAEQAEEVAKIGKEIFYRQIEGQEVSEEMRNQYNKKADELAQKVRGFSVFNTFGRVPVVGSFEPVNISQVEMKLERNKYHWLNSKQKIDDIIFKRWSSNEYVWASLISNEIDAAHPNMPKDVVEQLNNLNSRLKVISVSDLSDISLIFNFKKQMFNDLALRKSIAYILNRDTIRDVSSWQANSYENYYAYGLLKSMSNEWIDEANLNKFTKYSQNKTLAEQILEEAGYKKDNGIWHQSNGNPVEFTISVYGPHNDWVLAAREIVQQLKSFGFKVDMKLIPEGMRDNVMRTGDYDVAIEFGTAWWGYPHPLTGYRRLYEGDIALITGFPSTEKYLTPWGELAPKDLIEELNNNLYDEIKAKEIIEKLAYITNEYLPIIPIKEKVLPIYFNNGFRVQGWPDEKDPIWSLAPGGIERVYNLLIGEGILYPIE
ncbi:ABC transporter substrate-binding protein [Anaerobranca gottschalkii]|uniref:Peptide/nickel transport system substrate-binding protein n=1 Tax=Anaerobranca gottschalkii DSM 13577 TaxID=1120990 RepID=A0A1H9YHP3_9FIRM|nr:ABC transporter substrate-binding protein [Anaerobranca gottschalkii]SES68471.1 peptide/nickel transport system substrate-binding protein [Anaerobranca gottschalkii DSM 13577]